MVKILMSGRWTAACASLATSVVLLAGCSDGSSDPKPLPEHHASGPSSTPQETKHTEALATYRAMWRDLAEASKTSDASSPRLDDHAGGAAVEFMKQGLRSAKEDQVVIKGTPRLQPAVVSGTERKVSLRDCVDSTHWLEYKLNGELKNSTPGGHSKAEATVEREGDQWEVTQLSVYRSGSC